MKRTPFLKHIYKRGKKYTVTKSIKGKQTYFKTFNNLDDAVKYRDQLIANDWQPLPETSEEKTLKETKEYYRYIHKDSYRRYYRIYDSDTYYGMTHSIEEALYYRDLILSGEVTKRPQELDLKTDNPYIHDGLKYPLPERLILPERKSQYGKGTIVKKGPYSYHIHHGSKLNGKKSFVCACRTYEMADHVKKELNKCNWDLTKLNHILEEYPRYYTWLLFFYQYITHHRGKWLVMIPKEYTNDGKVEVIRYNHLEDALFERDFLKEHNWDYTLLVETINDEDNPYYDMDLPPYPQRKIKNIHETDYHEKELTEVVELLRLDFTQLEICEKLNITSVTLRNWLKRLWNTNFNSFKEIVDNGENPLDVLEKVEILYQPDLSKPMPPNYNNYVSRLNTPYGIRYTVQRRGIHYGRYPNEELAMKISKDMAKRNWDKSKLKEVQAKHGWQSMVNSKRWVYPNKCSWSVRHKDKNRKMINFGTYRDKRVADIVRDMLITYGWNKNKLAMIQENAYWIIYIYDLYPSTMFGVKKVEDIEYIEATAEEKTPYVYQAGAGYNVIRNNIYYARYKSKEKAVEVVEFLMDNNWDKELLKLMQEIGEI